MQRICVFAGSNQGVRAEYAQAARETGQELANRGLGLVYGGGKVGLMGLLADSILAAGGEAIGVIPRALVEREIGHKNLTKLYEVESMHERKAMMADLADGFIALPGGFGTFDELFEILTWAQLGIHQKPVGILNIAGYFDLMLSFIQHTANEGFVPGTNTGLIIQSTEPGKLLDSFQAFVPVIQNKWMDPPRR